MSRESPTNATSPLIIAHEEIISSSALRLEHSPQCAKNFCKCMTSLLTIIENTICACFAALIGEIFIDIAIGWCKVREMYPKLSFRRRQTWPKSKANSIRHCPHLSLLFHGHHHIIQFTEILNDISDAKLPGVLRSADVRVKCFVKLGTCQCQSQHFAAKNQR
jgi:hypothetical protein